MHPEIIEHFLQNFTVSSRKEDVYSAFINNVFVNINQRALFNEFCKTFLNENPKMSKIELMALFIHNKQLSFDGLPLLMLPQEKKQLFINKLKLNFTNIFSEAQQQLLMIDKIVLNGESLMINEKNLSLSEEQKSLKPKELEFPIPVSFLNESLFEALLNKIHSDRCLLHLLKSKDKFKVKMTSLLTKLGELFPHYADLIVSPEQLMRILEKMVFEYVESTSFEKIKKLIDFVGIFSEGSKPKNEEERLDKELGKNCVLHYLKLLRYLVNNYFAHKKLQLEQENKNFLMEDVETLIISLFIHQ